MMLVPYALGFLRMAMIVSSTVAYIKWLQQRL